MQSLTFILEASLLAPLVEFAMSSSGHVEPRQGLALGWMGSVVAGLAVVFSTADQAHASCPPAGQGYKDNCSWVCGSVCRRGADGTPIKWNAQKYCNSEINGCRVVKSDCISC